eukprot:GHVH01011579.1.p1 GENE.GHVH01011579.1~~GHVH01011579.1.p1  ORF type:complete len:379 (+),score=51.24 GHVH01011579.1:953-2089(+)
MITPEMIKLRLNPIHDRLFNQFATASQLSPDTRERLTAQNTTDSTTPMHHAAESNDEVSSEGEDVDHLDLVDLIKRQMEESTRSDKTNKPKQYILFDKRERASLGEKEDLASVFTRLYPEVPSMELNLGCGDIAWAIDVEGVLIYSGFVIERKCGSDFVSSLMDGRLEEQRMRIITSPATRWAGYLIEGSISSAVTQMKQHKLGRPGTPFSIDLPRVESAIQELSSDYGLSVHRSDNTHASAHYLRCLHSRFESLIGDTDNLPSLDLWNSRTVKGSGRVVSSVFGLMLKSMKGCGVEQVDAILTLADTPQAMKEVLRQHKTHDEWVKAMNKRIVGFLPENMKATYRPKTINQKLLMRLRLLFAPDSLPKDMKFNESGS